jgi:hypothetical protein
MSSERSGAKGPFEIVSRSDLPQIVKKAQNESLPF